MFKFLLQLAMCFLPWALRRRMLIWFLGFDIHPGARIGLSLIRADHLVMGPGSRIGSLTMVKGLRLLELGAHASLGNLNWVSGFPLSIKAHFSHVAGRDTVLRIQEHAAITNRHLIDCTDSVTIGRFTTVAGFRSQFLTHSIEFSTSRQSCKPIVIGEYCFVGTGCILLPGAALPDRCVLAAGAVLKAALKQPDTVYGGVPAKALARISTEDKYFNRAMGFVY